MSDLEDRLAAVEKRLGELEDERRIRELLSRYGYYADACLDDEYLALFTEDGAMDVSRGGTDDPYAVLRWEGREAMRTFLTDRTAAHGDGFAGRSLHLQGNNLTVTVRGDTAVAAGYSFIFHQDGSRLRLLSASTNEWRLVKADGEWRIAVRKRRMLGAPDTAEVLTSTERA
ncbi:nuclear transport factor 2 family protein [Prauserella cavernicola]|uniref:Nuclear transport factor 2 family protein n=1 Tax=Prauserella cavernicola TaxID=2800127 RepID=A0A934V7D2_9PSEU|nr:nuclear transport factor 2 family protein [Prauserella cavernicola]MBK1787120.1 nuclear transport factor 2 family protein [Prauserella cavernicola]